MKAILCTVLLLAAQSARAELFEMSGTLTCSFPSVIGKLDQTKYSTREIVAAALSTDVETAKRFALVFNSETVRISVVERCDGSNSMIFAVNQSVRSTTGEPKNGKLSYANTHLFAVTDWDGSAEAGTVTCSLTGFADENTLALLTAKGRCVGALTIFDGEQGYYALKAKIGKALKITNDCPT